MSAIQFNIDESPGLTKLQILINAIVEAVGNGKLKTGEILPSVNQLSNETGFSRDTVFKAYQILKKRNIIESAPQKGYFVASETQKVFMLLDDFSAFKEKLYQSFRQNTPQNYSTDLLFHHYNPAIFNQLIEQSIGRYSLYIVMNINHNTVEPVLKKLEPGKLLILDMGNPGKADLNYLLQDFGKSVQECLESSLERINKYKEIVLVYEKNNMPHPEETVTAVKDFSKKHEISFRKVSQFKNDMMEKGKLFFVIRDSDLVNVIKSSLGRNWILGRDVGIISYNDTPMKEVVGGGISVISTDFNLMGELAAGFVKNKKPIRKILPTFLTLRQSF